MYLPLNLIMKFLEPIIKEEPPSEEDMDIWCREMSLECMLCSKTFHSITGLKAHVIALHSYKSVKRKIRNNPSPAKRERKDIHVCATCRRTFFTSTDLMVHETCHSKLACYVCHQKFDNFSLLTNHRKRCTVTETPKPKTLDDVKRLPADESKLETARFGCPACSEHFSDEYLLEIHQEIRHSAANSEASDNGTNTVKMKETTTQSTRETMEAEGKTVKETTDTVECVNRTSKQSDNVSKEAKGEDKDTYDSVPKTPTVTTTEASATSIGQNVEGVNEIVRNVHETIPANDITLNISEITSDVDLNLLSVNGTLVSKNDNTEVVNVVPTNEERTMKYINKEVENVHKDTDESEVSTAISAIRTDTEKSASKIFTENLHVFEPTKNASEIETSKHVDVPFQKPDNMITSDQVNKFESTALHAVNETPESSSALIVGEKTILDKEMAQIEQSTVGESLETVNKTQANITETVEENTEKLEKHNKTFESLKEIPKNIIGKITKVESDKLETIFGVVSTESKSEVDS